MTFRYGSVCSGIEAASVAWHPLGWRASFLSEIEVFPRAVLSHHHPETPLHGDFTTIRAGEYEPIDLLVGGTPCQSFSIAGLRGGLDDDRGNLALEYLRLADRLRPRWLVWENVPGVLSSNGGRDFGSILGGMGELGYGVAYRVLDAQFFGVAQRRRRVFVVGYAGDWRRAAAVLFERHSLSGHSAPRRKTGKAAPTIPSRSTGGGGLGTDFDCDGGLIPFASIGNGKYGPGVGSLRATGANCGGGSETLIAHTLKGEGFDASEDGTGRGTPIAPVAYRVAGDGAAYHEGDRTAPITTGTDSSASIVAFDTTQITSAANYSNPKAGDPCHPLASGAHAPAVAYSMRTNQTGQNGSGVMAEIVPALAAHESAAAVTFAIQERAVSTNIDAGPQGKGYQEGVAYTLEARNKVQSVASSAVRRLTPRECERLQGFPDGYTLIPYRNGQAADGPRYKALGNSMAVPVMAHIGRRIAAIEALSVAANQNTSQPEELAALPISTKSSARSSRGSTPARSDHGPGSS